MRTETSNKLLKIIEEPPKKTLFLLVSNNHERIISTIKSRTQLLKIPKVSDLDIEEFLEENHVSGDQVEYIVNYSNGDFNKANKMLHQENVLNEHFPQFADWMRSCYKRDYAWVLKWSDQLHKSGREKHQRVYSIRLKHDQTMPYRKLYRRTNFKVHD